MAASICEGCVGDFVGETKEAPAPVIWSGTVGIDCCEVTMSTAPTSIWGSDLARPARCRRKVVGGG
ncbi:hypothetical protein E2562_033736 [Oryza meyeriana var. granulata]|uniref:Uncharacterized protein n=1 Tax=Oryza meyeriana var. granulata TaxID=110450 RepID=A0A6G1CKG4_9ORYZ|nr:hypothetical protein E2562_033736 [Oryza meyeriana var. granulata]